jgi:hypothetical protein
MDRAAVRDRLNPLLDNASLSTLKEVEALLQASSGSTATLRRNPSGNRIAEPCLDCGGLRPPHPDCQPWDLRRSAEGDVARGARCQPCQFARKFGLNRQSQGAGLLLRGLRPGRLPAKDMSFCNVSDFNLGLFLPTLDLTRNSATQVAFGCSCNFWAALLLLRCCV